MTARHPSPPPPRRWDTIDVARGAAILAMIAYHVFWDLSFLQLTAMRVAGDPLWNGFARAIAGSFLALAGFGLVLAHGRSVRPGAFLRRLARIAGAALAVTLATYLAFPESYIFFGILHCIALGSVLALPFLRAPLWLVVAAAAASLLAPKLFTNPALDHPLLEWLGLGTRDPVTNDYVPVFPWFGAILLGIALGRWALRRGESGALARWPARHPLARALAWAGRHSLPIYLIHQPVLLALLMGVLQVTGPHPQAQVQSFIAQCVADCSQANGDTALCRSACACMAERLRENGTLAGARASATPENRARVSEAAQACLRDGAP